MQLFQISKLNVTHVNVSLSFRCKMMSLERKCSDGVEQMMGVLEQRLHNPVSPTDLWEKTVSFFTPKKTLLFHNGYSKYSRETLRLFPDSAEDVAPLCIQQWQELVPWKRWKCICQILVWKKCWTELTLSTWNGSIILRSYFILFFPQQHNAEKSFVKTKLKSKWTLPWGDFFIGPEMDLMLRFVNINNCN